MPVRLRFPELLAAHRLTAYQVHTRSGGRITHTMAHRLARTGGRFVTLKAEVIDALAEIFGVPLHGAQTVRAEQAVDPLRIAPPKHGNGAAAARQSGKFGKWSDGVTRFGRTIDRHTNCRPAGQGAAGRSVEYGA